MKLNRQPLCEMCLKCKRYVKADIVDHIVEIKKGGHPLDMDNLQSLCRSCHTVKTNRERVCKDEAVSAGGEEVSMWQMDDIRF